MRATIVLSALLVIWGCAPAENGHEGHAEAAPADAEAAHPALNQLTPAEAEAGWELLFDGKSLDGWRGYQLETLPAGWSVDEGTIHFVPPEEGERADLVTVEQFGDFELGLEWKVSPGSNSGVFFRVSEDHERSYNTGPEVQILDNSGHRDGQSPTTSAGSDYALHAPVRDVTRPVGEWNELRVLVDGDHVEHWMNGETIVAYTLWDDAWHELVAASKFASMPGYGRNHVGHIVLQDHGDEVWYRNVKVRRIGDTAP